ncbi:hypothetical protein [Cerasicoccus frondis]|uniref:hypothetical protein n=1 Tax=Cerasicoccus frondis TaxID=490090 RepID=UPI0028525B45|nr:hypothetical protein [Cerasicoccus frondis]
MSAQLTEVNLTTNVPLSRVIDDALSVARQNPSWVVMLGSGQSMLPYFGEGSVLLVERARYDELEPGMMAVYLDKSGDLVSHQLIRKVGSSWVTQGVNNAVVDKEYVGAHNYLGVVFGVLNSSGADPVGLAYAKSQGVQLVVGKSPTD